ncbi:hypothetical protein [Pusillimonas sp. ANT_WB101]|uniref:hypothetical protein n=1 Tax=Pusillimonas sp. ANT_WB101 TaxID=2597356 RepID=UPI0015D3FD27|nr:hypothetical protein [Pusillimonas sp. ANT_WB101]NYT77677.1 hypothetical protein [Alcaligenaceae bacterium]
MNSRAKQVVVAVAAAMLTLSLAACQKEGPAEKAGKKLDNAVSEAGAKIENATK